MAKKRKMHPNSLKNLEKGKWPPGTSGNPKGPPKKILTQLREALKLGEDETIGATLTKSDYQDICLWLMERTQAEIKKLVADKKTPSFVVIIARAIQRDMSRGGLWAFDNLFDKFLSEEQDTSQQVIFMTGFDLGDNEPEKLVDPTDPTDATGGE